MPPPPAEPAPRGRRVTLLGAVLGAALLAGAHLVFGVFEVSGASMTPGLEAGQRVLVLRRRWCSVERGDLVVFRNPIAPDELLVKRVLALPGEVLRARGGRVVVGRFEQAEPYLAPGPRIEDLPPTAVPPDHYFVLGDNRSQSVDSRRFGPVRADLLEGVVVARLWGGGP